MLSGDRFGRIPWKRGCLSILSRHQRYEAQQKKREDERPDAEDERKESTGKSFLGSFTFCLLGQRLRFSRISEDMSKVLFPS